MSSEFFCSLIRISCAQILRTNGIERFSPVLLDTITDILIRHLTGLSRKASDYASLSGRNEVVIQDVVLAMEEMGVIRPRSVLDPYDLDPNGMIGYESFIEWVKGPIAEEARVLSREAPSEEVAEVKEGVRLGSVRLKDPQKEEVKGKSVTEVVSAKEAVTSATEVVKGTTETETTTATETVSTSKTTTTTTTDTTIVTTSTTSAAPATIAPTLPTTSTSTTSKNPPDQWLTSLMKKRIKVGNENKFKGTVLSNDNFEIETKIAGGPNLEDFQMNV